jgi:hypothetical protein
MSKKKLVINCATCDARNVSEETLSSYESININAASLITSSESRTLLHKHNVAMNCAEVAEIPKDADIIQHNGKYTISAKDESGKPAVLVVNGSLTIEPGAEAAMKRFVSIKVNGRVICPESMSSSMGSLSVNGTTVVYPDDAILLKNTFVVDRAFILRSKSSKYFAQRCVVLIDTDLDVDELVRKGVSFITNTAIVADSLFEAALPLFGDKAEIITVPDGCKYLNDDATLNNRLLRKHGTKLIIDGDLMIEPTAGEFLARIEYLRVRGTIMLPAVLEDQFYNIDSDYDSLTITRGKLIKDKVFVKIDMKLLEQNPDGITVTDCVNITIVDDITPEMILDKLELSDCVNVVCTPEQRSAVEQVSDDVVNIGDAENGGIGQMVKGLITGKSEDNEGTVYINSAFYVL